MADELAEGFFRVIFAAVRAIAGFLVEVLRDVVAELFAQAIVRIVVAFFRVIGVIFEIALRIAQVLHFFAFRKPVGERTMLVHAIAIAVVMVAGFFAGATASVVYHADWRAADTVASYAVER